MQAFREHNVIKRARLVSRTPDSRLMERECYHYATRAGLHNERFRDMYTFSELILNIRKVGKIDSRKMQGQSPFR